jgi:anti-sigma B factor antagonist
MREMVTPDLSGPVPVARVAGEVDLANAARLRQELLALATDEVDGLVVDVTDVPYADSAGIRVLFDLARDLRQRNQSLAVTVPVSSSLRRLLKITNFQEVAPICDDAETAVQLIAKGPPRASRDPDRGNRTV